MRIFIDNCLFCIPFRALYHTLAGHDFLKRRSVANLVSHFWWFRGFIWMEENIKVRDLELE